MLYIKFYDCSLYFVHLAVKVAQIITPLGKVVPSRVQTRAALMQFHLLQQYTLRVTVPSHKIKIILHLKNIHKNSQQQSYQSQFTLHFTKPATRN